MLHLIYFLVESRIIPGVLTGGGCCLVGMGAGMFVASPFLNPTHFKPTHIVFLALLAPVLLAIRSLWRRTVNATAAAEMLQASPRLLAVLFTLCLLVGIGVGILLAMTRS